jgi:hypothetical protein
LTWRVGKAAALDEVRQAAALDEVGQAAAHDEVWRRRRWPVSVAVAALSHVHGVAEAELVHGVAAQAGDG